MTDIDAVSARPAPATNRPSGEKGAAEVKTETRIRQDVEVTLQIEEQKRLDELTYEKLSDRKRLAERSSASDQIREEGPDSF